MSTRSLVAIGLDQDRLSIVSGVLGEHRAQIKLWHSAQAQGIDLKSAAAVGAWLAKELEKVGLSKSKLVIAVPRGEVVLKRLRLPSGEASELAGMVRLQMTRQLTMALEGTAIDYVPLNSSASVDAAGEGEGGISVLAAALPGDRMAWYREMAKAAGCKIERLGLRSAGVAALLSELSQRQSGPVLGVAAGYASVEFVVVQDGELVFTRAADVGMGAAAEGDHSFVARIAVEAKRTWMSYRVGEGLAEIEAVVVPGEGELAVELADKCAEAMEMPWKLCPFPPSVSVEATVPATEAIAGAPLLGLFAEEAMGRPALDFANPRKAPDLGAARRQRVLAAAFLAIVVGGAAVVYASGELSSLRAKLRSTEQRRGSLAGEFARFQKEDARLNHITQWTGAGMDWLGHASFISDTMPDPRQAQLDQLGGRLGAEVEMVPKSGRYDPAGWRVAQAAAFTVSGKVKRREVADDLRARLVKSYEQVETKGADTPASFALEIKTARPTPLVQESSPAKPPPGAGAPKTKGDSK